MPVIPNVIVTLPDELTSSYLARLAAANALDKMMFLQTYISGKKKTKYLDADQFRIFNRLCRALEGTSVTADDLVKTTMLPALSPFMREEKKDAYILKMFGYPETLGIMNMKSLVGDLVYCPECRNNDIASYGIPYLHRIHHVPGFTRCPLHHGPLYSVKTGEAVTEGKQAIQKGYENLLLDLLEDPLICSYEEMKEGMIKRLSEMTASASASPYKEASTFLMESGYLSCQDAGMASSLLSTGTIPIEIMLRLAGHCFSSGTQMRQYIQHQDGENLGNMFCDEAEALGYSVVAYSRFIVQLSHHRCGTKFFSSASAFKRGYRCPMCDSVMTPDGLFRRIVECSCSGSYIPETEFRGLTKKVKIRHMTCGKQFETSARGFLYDGRRCDCGRIYTECEARKKVGDAGAFQLIYFSGMDGRCEIKAAACGHIFTMRSLRKFLKNPYCRICHPNTTDEEFFRREIADLTGDEYEYIAGYDGRTTPLTMRHHTEVGSHDFTMSPSAFLTGQRCPFCKKQVRKKDFVRTVRDLSAGRYEVIGFKNDTRCTIRDIETGSVRDFGRGFVLQELQRPTRSKSLPHKVRDTSACCKNTMEKVLQAVKTTFPPENGGEIRAGEVIVDGMNRVQIMRVINVQLVKAGYLTKTGRGIYEWRVCEKKK